jgi:hypothetical protein
MSVFFPTKFFLFRKFRPLGSRNIQVFRKVCEKFKYPAKKIGRAETYTGDLTRSLKGQCMIERKDAITNKALGPIIFLLA